MKRASARFHQATMVGSCVGNASAFGTDEVEQRGLASAFESATLRVAYRGHCGERTHGAELEGTYYCGWHQTEEHGETGTDSRNGSWHERYGIAVNIATEADLANDTRGEIV